jgi:hypothetical protein
MGHTECPKTSVGTINQHCAISQKSEDLIYTVVEVLNHTITNGSLISNVLATAVFHITSMPSQSHTDCMHFIAHIHNWDQHQKRTGNEHRHMIH